MYAVLDRCIVLDKCMLYWIVLDKCMQYCKYKDSLHSVCFGLTKSLDRLLTWSHNIGCLCTIKADAR